jgi:hypothetical protein
VVDDARGGVVDQGEERRQQRGVGGARFVGGRVSCRDQLRIVQQAPRRRRQLGEVLSLRVQRVIERCRDVVRLTTTRSVTPDT